MVHLHDNDSLKMKKSFTFALPFLLKKIPLPSVHKNVHRSTKMLYAKPVVVDSLCKEKQRVCVSKAFFRPLQWTAKTHKKCYGFSWKQCCVHAPLVHT